MLAEKCEPEEPLFTCLLGHTHYYAVMQQHETDQQVSKHHDLRKCKSTTKIYLRFLNQDSWIDEEKGEEGEEAQSDHSQMWSVFENLFFNYLKNETLTFPVFLHGN